MLHMYLFTINQIEKNEMKPCTFLTTVTVRGLGNQLTLQPPWAYSEIPGDIKVKIRTNDDRDRLPSAS